MGLFGFFWRRRWGKAAVVYVTKPPSPTQLQFDLTTHRLAFEDVTTHLAFESVRTQLGFQADDGSLMSTPLVFTAGETGPLTMTCTGADGTAENLPTAQTITFTMVNIATGVVKVNAVALGSPTSNGTAIWTRQASEVDTPGDYVGQVKVVRSDGTIGYFPDADGLAGFSGSAISLLKPAGS